MEFKDFLIKTWEVAKGSIKAREKLKAEGHLEEGQDSLGGFTVPTEAYEDIMEITLEESIVRPRAQVIKLGSDAVNVPTLTDTSHASSVFGGITCYWTGEAVDKTEKNPKVGSLGLQANKLVGFVYLSDEWMADVAVENFLEQTFGEAVAYYADDAYVNGTGVGQPLGILNAPATVSVAKEGGQSPDTLLHENIYKMGSRLLPQSHKKAIWLAHPDTLPQLGGLTSDVRYIGPGFYILGKEVLWSEKCQTIGDTGDIMLTDFSKYVIADRGLTISASKHPRFPYDETMWRFVLRTDGQPLLSSAITPKNGSDSLSPFIKLNART